MQSTCLVKVCELCQLSRTTTWYAEYDEPFRFVILDCDSCEVPMAVLGAHRAQPTDQERAVMKQAIAAIADARYENGWFFDDHMRQIPDHYHLHARPYPAWWPRASRAKRASRSPPQSDRRRAGLARFVLRSSQRVESELGNCPTAATTPTAAGHSELQNRRPSQASSAPVRS